MDRQTFDLVRTLFIAARPAARVKGKVSQPIDIAVLSRLSYDRLFKAVIELAGSALGGTDTAERLAAFRSAMEPGFRNLPVLSDASIEKFRGEIKRMAEARADLVPVAMAAVSALLVHFRHTALPNQSAPGLSRFDDEIRLECASYVSWLHIVEYASGGHSLSTVRDIEEQSRATLLLLREELAEITQRSLDGQRRAEKTDGMLGVLQTKIEDGLLHAREQINEALAKVSHVSQSAEALNFRVEGSRSNIEAFRAAVTEEVRGTETRKLWKDRDTEAWKAFAISGGLLAVLLLAIPLFGLWQIDWVIKTLRHIGEATTEGIPSADSGTLMTVATISRLVVITFPLVLYLWLVRLVVRFNMRSITLHDDARQRQTMMDTYFILLERQAATPEERGLILNALFRPAPGQGPDNLDPPAFIDFIGKASSAK